MTRTTVTVEEDILDTFRRAAAERNVSMAALIREAMQEKAEKLRPKPLSLGIFESGIKDSVADLGRELGEPRTWHS